MGYKTLSIILVLAAILGHSIFRQFSPTLIVEPPDAGNGWWGRGPPEVSAGKQDTSVREFRVNVSDEVLADLKYRLQNTRFVDRVEDAAFHYGTDSDYMKQVQRFWLEKYR